MDTRLLEIHEHRGDGYRPLVDHGEWRVAILCFMEDLLPNRIRAMERHTETDEVFVLLRGRGILLIGGNGGQVDRVRPEVMQPAKIYNVKRNAWHTILMSRDASVLLVENSDIGEHNTEHLQLSPEERLSIQETSRREQVP